MRTITRLASREKIVRYGKENICVTFRHPFTSHDEGLETPYFLLFHIKSAFLQWRTHMLLLLGVQPEQQK